PKIPSLKTLKLHLEGSLITDQFMKVFSKSIPSIMKELETFQLGLWNTEISSKEVASLFVEMKKIKYFWIDLIDMIDYHFQKFLDNTLTSIQDLEYLTLGLSSTKVTDESIIQLFKKMKNIKYFQLNLNDTTVTDKSMNIFIDLTLPKLKSLKILDMKLR